MSKADRKLLKRAGFGREFKEMGALACALEEVKNAPYVPGYAVEADVAHGVRTRRRVRRERWNRMGRVMRGLFLCGAAGPSSRDRRTRSCYAEAPALRSSAPTVLVVVGLVVLLVAAVWLLE